MRPIHANCGHCYAGFFFFQIERAVLKRMQKWDGMFAGDRKWIRVTEA